MSLRCLINFEKLRTCFEGKIGIYREHGALLVRVTNINLSGKFCINADVEEIPMKGLGVGRLQRAKSSDPARWYISAGHMTSFSAESWHMGYGMWSIFFSPRIVEEVCELASEFPDDMDSFDRYRRISEALRDSVDTEPVFPEVLECGSLALRNTDIRELTEQVSGGWIRCPGCGIRFKPTEEMLWDGHRHLTCGQRILLHASPLEDSP